MPWIVIIFMLGFLSTIAIYITKSNEIVEWQASKKDFIKIMSFVILTILFFIISGLAGYFPSHGDYHCFRQALFLNLKNDAWPIFLPNGKEMSYYIAGVLPPAMLSRLLPTYIGQMSVVIFTSLPFILTFLILCAKWKRAPWILLLVMMVFQDPLRSLFGSGESIDYSLTNYTLAYLAQILPNSIDLSILTTPYGNQTFGSMMQNSAGGSNSIPYTILASAMVTNLNHQEKWLHPLIIALLLPASPLGALALLPIATYLFLRDSKVNAKTILSLALPIFIVFVTCVYFLRVDSSINTITLATVVRGKAFFIFYIRHLIGLTILTLPIYSFRKNDSIFWIAIVSATLSPFLFIGSLPTKDFPGVNELAFKGIVVYTFIFAYMWVENWAQIRKLFTYTMFFFMMILLLALMIVQIRHFDTNRTVADMWNGHLNHNRNFLLQSVPKTKDPILPHILLRKGNSSEKHFPGILLPKAPGCNYNLPPKNDALL